MQQATVNLFADMGVQPHDADRRARTAATRRPTPPPPTRRSRSPTAGPTCSDGSKVTISGTADRRRRRRRRRRRGLDRRRLDLAPGA